MNRCNIPIFHCEDCNSSAVRYFDYDHASFQILCDSGFLQFKVNKCFFFYIYVVVFQTSDGHAYQYDYRIWMEKETCSLYGAGGLAITAVSCKGKSFWRLNAVEKCEIEQISTVSVRPYEIDECLGQVGSPPGLTGHCRFGTCWLYCQDKSKQLSFETYIVSRIHVRQLETIFLSLWERERVGTQSVTFLFLIFVFRTVRAAEFERIFSLARAVSASSDKCLHSMLNATKNHLICDYLCAPDPNKFIISTLEP